MIENSFPTESKVLVYDCSLEHENRIKEFCGSSHLIAVKSASSKILDILKSYVDLGAIFLSEDIESTPGGGIDLGREIHRIRPELPIFLRRCSPSTQTYDEQLLKSFCTIYDIDSVNNLQDVIEQHIFCAEYPNALVRGIEEITRDTLYHFFDDVEIEVATPYVVKDRIIYGELFSLMPVESYWCKGYMMIQLSEDNVLALTKTEKISGSYTDTDNFRVINDILSEITNMSWGGIKNRFVSEEKPLSNVATQVPIIVNHKNKYISFGTNAPQLCFKYTLREKSGERRSFSLFHKFIFNLYWQPERFSENQPTVNDLVNAGELDFF